MLTLAASLQEQVRQRTWELQVLNELTGQLQLTGNADEIWLLCLARLPQLIPGEAYAAIALPSHQIYQQSPQPLTREVRSAIEEYLQKVSRKENGGKEGELATEEPGKPDDSQVVIPELNSVLVAPSRLEESQEGLGIFLVGARADNCFNFEHLCLLHTVAQLVATALMNLEANRQTVKLDRQHNQGEFPAKNQQQEVAIAGAATERTPSTLLTHILDRIADAFFAVDRNWKLIYLNQAAENLFFKTAEQLRGRNLWEEMPAAVGSSFYYQCYQAVSAGEAVKFEEFYQPLNAWFEIRVYPSMEGLAIYWLDISGRKQKELALRASEERLKTIVANTSDAILILDQLGRVLFVNRAAECFFGRSTENLIGTEFGKPIANGGVAELLIVRQHRILTVEMRVAETQWEGEPAYLASLRDISSLKGAEAVLQKITRLQQAIFDSANCTIIATDPNGIIQTFNPSAEKHLGYTAEEVTGKATPEIFHDPSEMCKRAASLSAELGFNITPGFETFVAKARLGIPDENEWSYIRKDGSCFPVMLSVTALKDEEGNITGFLGVGNDITARYAAVEALRQSQAQLQKITANIPGMVYQFSWHSDQTITFAFVSAGCQDLFEIAPETVQQDAKAILNLLSESDRQAFFHSITVSIATWEPCRWEGKITTSSGKVKWIQGVAQPEVQPSGEIIYYGLFVDISERKQAELKLQLYQEIFLRSNDAIAILDPQGYYLERNDAELALLGYTEAELTGKTPSIYMGEETFATIIDSLTKTGRYRGEVTCWKVWEMGVVEVDISAFSVLNDAGEILCLVSVKRDINERKQAEDKLKLYREIFLKSNDAIAILDADSFFLEQNPAHQRLLGYTNSELEGKKSQLMQGEEFLEVIQTLATVGTFRGEVINYTKNGNLIPIDLSAFSVKNNEGDIICYVGFKRDITERKRTEEEREKFVLLIENSSDFIGMATMEGQVLFVNEAGQRMVGLENVSEALATEIIHYIPLSFQQELNQEILPTVIAQGKWQGEGQLQHFCSGKLIDAWMNIFLIKHHKTGKPLCFATVIRDMTERKQAERLLQASEQLLREQAERERLVSAIAQRVRQSLNLTQTLSTAVQEVRQLLQTDRTVIYCFAADGTGRVVVESVAACWMPLLGKEIQDHFFTHTYIPLYQSGRIRAIEDIYTADLNPCHIDLLEQLQVRALLVVPIVIGEENQESAAEVLDSQSPSPIQNRLWGLLIAHQCSDSRAWTASEIDLLKQLSVQLAIAIQQSTLFEQVQKSQEAALEASRMKSLFLANMSHEIRTPMNGVLGMTDLLLRTRLTPEQLDFVQTLKVSGQNLLSLLNDILDFSKLEAGEMRLEVLDFDLNLCLDEVLDLLATPAQNKGIELACLIDSDVPLQIRGDVARLRQVLTNLIGNGIKFTEVGEVVIHLSIRNNQETHNSGLLEKISSGNIEENQFIKISDRQPKFLLFQVIDTGIGIAPEEQVKLFQPFNQVDASMTRKYGGTGLGLAICKQLVELMGGEIGVESTPKSGSTFWFTLPLLPQKLLPRVSSDEFPQSTALSGLKLLVVNNQPTLCKVMRKLAARWGMEVDEVERGWMAIIKLRNAFDQNRPYDLALIDMQLPEMTGRTLEALMKADATMQHTKWILLTSMRQQKEAKRLVRMGFSGYLTKPIKASRLFDCLLNAVEHKREADPEKPEIQEVKNFREISNDSDSLPKTKGLKVLLVEDTPTNQKVSLNQLKVLGYEAEIANNGQEALAMLAVRDYDLVFMDCQMPVMDGYEATKELRRREAEGGGLSQRGCQEQKPHRKTVVIAMTAHALKGDREKCLAAGMDDYISKPIVLEELQTLLERWSGELKISSNSLNNGEAEGRKQEAVTFKNAKNPKRSKWNQPNYQFLIDWERLHKISGSDAKFEQDLLQTFAKDARQYLEAVKIATATEDAVEVARRAHQLKGGSAIAAVRFIPNIAGKLETLAQSNNLEEAVDSIVELEIIVTGVEEFIANW